VHEAKVFEPHNRSKRFIEVNIWDLWEAFGYPVHFEVLWGSISKCLEAKDPSGLDGFATRNQGYEIKGFISNDHLIFLLCSM
jgi:hypothetical protein